MLESPEDMDNNVYCNFCMKCQPACPSQNLSLRFRSFGKDIYASLRKSKAEAIAVLLLLGVAIVETLAMTSSWEPLKGGFSSVTGITAPSLVYTIVFIPMGAGLHFAHNIQHLLIESPIALPATIRFLQNIGKGTHCK